MAREKLRDRERTKKKILSAVGEIIEQHGIDQVGIGSIAKISFVNKALVYRYFQTIDNLIYQLFNTEVSQYQSVQQQTLNPKMTLDDVQGLLLKQFHSTRGNRLFREIMKYEIQKNKPILSSAQDQILIEALSHLKGANGGKDISALFALLSAGVFYLILLSDYQQEILGINLHSEEGWHRIENVINDIIQTSVVTNNDVSTNF